LCNGKFCRREARLVVEQPALALETAAVADERTVGGDKPVAGNDYCNRVQAIGSADRTISCASATEYPPARTVPARILPLEAPAIRDQEIARLPYTLCSERRSSRTMLP
jgi:hypothetical protein